MKISTLDANSEQTLVEQIVGWAEQAIEQGILRPGMRMTSIRRMACINRVSRATVVEAYDRLVAKSLFASRRGSGFFVRVRPRPSRAQPVPTAQDKIDVVWLVRGMYADRDPRGAPGSGFLPKQWCDAELLKTSMRRVVRGDAASILGIGSPEGYLPLREQLQLKLAEFGINVSADQVLTTSGVCHAADLVLHYLVRPGETVLVDDPGYMILFGRLTLFGAKLVGVPRNHEGPDLEVMARLVETHRPKLYITNTVLHNPTGASLTSAKAFQILRLSEQFDFMIFEDDVYADFAPANAVRLAAMDQLKRVIYASSFSKTLGANLRVGFLAASVQITRDLTNQKLLSVLTTPEFGERVIHKVLADGQFRKHAERLRGRLAQATEATLRALAKVGWEPDAAPAGGLFVWARSRSNDDTGQLVANAAARGLLLAPGRLFRPEQHPSPYLRFNVGTSADAKLLRILAEHGSEGQK